MPPIVIPPNLPLRERKIEFKEAYLKHISSQKTIKSSRIIVENTGNNYNPVNFKKQIEIKGWSSKKLN